MDCFIAKLTGHTGSEKEVRFYSSFARNYLRYYLESGMTLWHKDMYEILADACDRQEHYAGRDDIKDKQLRNTQSDINKFLKRSPEEETYRIKEFAPYPEKKTR